MAWKVNELEPGGSKVVVELEGIVDSTNLDEFFAFMNSVYKGGARRIVLDMMFTSYLSSSGLSVIADVFKRADREGGKLVVARASSLVRELFEVVQFDKIIDFFEDLDEAIAAV